MPSGAAPAPNVSRRVLLTQDLSIPNYQTAFVEVIIPAGGREGRHTHPGSAVVHVLEGSLTLDMEGVPSKTYQVGETFYIDTGKIHEGINNGNTPREGARELRRRKGQAAGLAGPVITYPYPES